MEALANSTTVVADIEAVQQQQQQQQQQHLATFDFWINGVFTNIVVILGLIGNLLTIVVLTRQAMHSSTNIYLCALAVWDSVVLVCTALLTGLQAVPALEYYKYHVYAYVVSYMYPVALIAQTATIWLTVSFTVERYIAVCHPLKAASMCTISRAKIVIIGVSLGSTLYNIPRWFEYRPEVFVDSAHNNQTIIRFGKTAFMNSEFYRQTYFSWLYVPIMCIVPLLVLLVLNAFLILAVRQSMKQRQNMQGVKDVKESRENNVTIMLVTVVIVFIICQVPALVYNIAFAVDYEYVETDYSYSILSQFRNFLVCLNSAVNFILYCALGQRFRVTFLKTFCRSCVIAKPTGAPQYVYSAVAMTPSHRTQVVRTRLVRDRPTSYVNNHHMNGGALLCKDANNIGSYRKTPSDGSQASNKSVTDAPPVEPQYNRNAFHTIPNFAQQNGSC